MDKITGCKQATKLPLVIDTSAETVSTNDDQKTQKIVLKMIWHQHINGNGTKREVA